MPAETAGQRAMAELRRDPYRSDRAIARAAQCDHKEVGKIRRQLESFGTIPPRPQPVSAAQRAERELKRDLARSDRLIAIEAGTDHHVVSRARQRLERAGVIEPAPVRAPRHKPGLRDKPRPALEAARLMPKATPRELAARFGLPYQSAWLALREQQRRAEPEPYPRRDRWAELPPPPDWSRGLCTQVKPSMRAWWTSAHRDERQAAARMCAGCPVLQACEHWSLALPLNDPAVYAGLSQAERQRKRRAFRDEIARQALTG